MLSYPDLFSDATYRDAFERSRALPPSVIATWCDHVTSLATRHAIVNPILVDLGSGGGRFTLPMARALRPFNGRVIAIDKSPFMLSALQEKLLKTDLTNVELLQADLSDYRLNISVNIFFASEVLQLVAAPSSVLACAASNAAASAMFVVRGPSHEQLRQITWLRLFPTALELDLQRAMDTGTLADELWKAGFRGPVTSFEVPEAPEVDAGDFMQALREKAFSILRAISPSDFETGLARARAYYSKMKRISSEVNVTCLTAWKTPWHENR